jgi:hypothetical protein
MNKYCQFQGEIITLSSFLSAPQKRVQFVYLGPTTDIREQMVGAEWVNGDYLIFQKKAKDDGFKQTNLTDMFDEEDSNELKSLAERIGSPGKKKTAAKSDKGDKPKRQRAPRKKKDAGMYFSWCSTRMKMLPHLMFL